MKRLYTKSILFCAVLMTCVASKAQINQIELLKNGTMNWGVHAYGPATKAQWWNIDECKRIYWQGTYSANFARGSLNFSLESEYPRFGTQDTLEFRKGNLYEDLYMKSLLLHYTSSVGSTSFGTTVDATLLQQLQAQKFGTEHETFYGLDLARLEQVMPDAVVTNEEGQKGINYSALLPVLLQSIERLNKQIEEQQQTLDALQAADVAATLKQAAVSGAVMPQHYTATFALPEKTTTAYVQLCDASGRQIKMVNVTGTNKLTIDLKELSEEGGYYTLIADGKVVELKKISLK